MESHAEKTGQPVVEGRRVRDHEDKGDDRRGDFQRVAVEALAEKVRHCRGVEVLGHDAGAAAQNCPGEKGAEQRVADSGPGGGDTVFPSELTGVADENDRREIGSPVGEGCEPGPDAAPPEDEAVDIRRALSAVEADREHDGKENENQCNFNSHKINNS